MGIRESWKANKKMRWAAYVAGGVALLIIVAQLNSYLGGYGTNG